MRKRFLFFFLALIITSCSSTKTENSNPLLAYNIKFSQGGGFTGNRTGYIIDSTGSVFSFSGFPFSQNKTVFKQKLTPEQINSLNDMFPSVILINYSQKGNMTTSISLTKDNIDKYFSWNGLEPGQEVPSELVNFYAALRNFIK